MDSLHVTPPLTTQPAIKQHGKNNVEMLQLTRWYLRIYNMIDFILCPHSHKSLLQDSSSYAGTKLTSDHRLVVARANISRVFGVWGKCTRTTTKSIHYATQQLAEPVVRLEYQLHHSRCCRTTTQRQTSPRTMAEHCRCNLLCCRIYNCDHPSNTTP